jgi:pyrimidine-nucleoside phosphorylase
MERMDQPVGRAVGNWLEVVQSVELLRGCSRDKDLEHLCAVEAAYMLVLSGVVKTVAEGIGVARENLRNGAALRKFEEMVELQGGDVDSVRHLEKYPRARYQVGT